MKSINHSDLLRVVAGEGGDCYIGIEAITTKKFALIKIGPDGATVTVANIRGVDVMAARGYDTDAGVLPAGYQMVAGGDDYFDAITLTAGNAEGVLFPEDPQPENFSVVVDGGAINDPMSIELGFDNTGNPGSKKVLWQVRDADDAVVQTGEAVPYFLKGSSLTVNIISSYFGTADTGYELDIKLEGRDTWTSSAAFEITAGA